MDAITKSLTERERERSSMDSRTHGLTDSQTLIYRRDSSQGRTCVYYGKSRNLGGV